MLRGLMPDSIQVAPRSQIGDSVPVLSILWLLVTAQFLIVANPVSAWEVTYHADTFPRFSPEFPVDLGGEIDFGDDPLVISPTISLANGLSVSAVLETRALDSNLENPTGGASWETAVRYANEFGGIEVANLETVQVFSQYTSTVPVIISTVDGGPLPADVDVDVALLIDGQLAFAFTDPAGLAADLNYVARGTGTQAVAAAALTATGFKAGTPGYTDAIAYTGLNSTESGYLLSALLWTLELSYSVPAIFIGGGVYEDFVEVEEQVSARYLNTTGSTVNYAGSAIYDADETVRIVSITSPDPNIVITYAPEPGFIFGLGSGLMAIALFVTKGRPQG